MTFKKIESGKYSVVENASIEVSTKTFYTRYIDTPKEIYKDFACNRDKDWIVSVKGIAIGSFSTLKAAKAFVEKLNGSTEEIIGNWFLSGMKFAFIA